MDKPEIGACTFSLAPPQDPKFSAPSYPSPPLDVDRGAAPPPPYAWDRTLALELSRSRAECIARSESRGAAAAGRGTPRRPPAALALPDDG
nr:unnamed protein product [Digitaria exilis]